MGITLREDPQRRSTEKINKEDPLRRSTEKISREDQERKALEKTMKLLQAAIIAILASGTLAGKLSAPATTAIYHDEQQGTVGEREATDYIDEPADYQDEASKKSNDYDVYDSNPVTDIPKHQSGILEDFQPADNFTTYDDIFQEKMNNANALDDFTSDDNLTMYGFEPDYPDSPNNEDRPEGTLENGIFSDEEGASEIEPDIPDESSLDEDFNISEFEQYNEEEEINKYKFDFNDSNHEESYFQTDIPYADDNDDFQTGNLLHKGTATEESESEYFEADAKTDKYEDKTAPPNDVGDFSDDTDSIEKDPMLYNTEADAGEVESN